MDNVLETLAKVAVIAIAVFLFMGWRRAKSGCNGCAKPASMAVTGPDLGNSSVSSCSWGGKKSWA